MLSRELRLIYSRLHGRYGPQHWWPADSRFEMIIGAFLTQNTAWTNVEKALLSLKTQRLLSVAGLRKASVARIARAIRPAGYFNQKAARLKGFVAHLDDRHKGRLSALLGLKTEPLRSELLSIRGIGPETADSIILYAAYRPSFVIDAYTRRIFGRIGLLDSGHDYENARRFFHKHLKKDVRVYNEYHALIVRHAKESCLKNRPDCRACCLNDRCIKQGVTHEK